MATGRAYARTALAGNPSDGYGGAVLAVTFDAFAAEARVQPADRTRILPESAIVAATVDRFGGGPVQIRWHNAIPRSVGLGSSSALAIATLRALAVLHRVELEPSELVSLAHAVEREDLGIPGGRQDQVVQANEGLLFMDFANGCYERLTTDLLPPLLIAYLPQAAEDSSIAHSKLRSRADRSEVRELMAQLAAIARAARDSLACGEHFRFARTVDETFDARARLMELDPRHVAMIASARERGASANYCGSGGAIVCVCRDAGHREDVAFGLAELGALTLAPKLI